MPKMTAKYSSALATARREGITTFDISHSQDALYARLQEAGHFWNSDLKTWETFDIADSDEPTKLILVRVWADADIVEEAADDICTSAKRRGWELIQRTTPYPCRPPKQREARIYLQFMPK